MRWAIEIQRTTLERRNLEDLLAGLGYRLFDAGPFLAFTSQEIDQCRNAAEAFNLAKRLKAALTGPAQIDPDFSLGSVIDDTGSTSTRHTFLAVQPGSFTVTGSTASLTIGPPVGLSADALKAWLRDRTEQKYQSRLEAQRSRLEPAYLEPRAAKVLQYLADPSPTAEVLYKIYELIEEHPSKRAVFHIQFALPANDFKRFQDSVHNPSVSGDWARHAYHNTPRTNNPMSRNEAESFVRGLAARWLGQLRASPQP